MSPDDSCRLCKVNMRESGPRVYAHSTDMFVSKTTPTISDRLAMMDLIVTPEPEQSNRCCQRCTSTLGRLEKDFPLFRQWEENVRLSSVSKRQREPTPSKTPRTLKKTCPNPPSPLACSFGNTTTKFPLGLFFKNENQRGDLVEVLREIQQEHMLKDADCVQHLLIGGDRLTEANCRNVQWGFSDADTKEERMEGMHFKFEDWHAIRVLFEIHHKIFFKESTTDHGTLFANMTKLSF
ncbi:uncharacterized protein LOC110960395 isoform X3 [Acanthochromis polyacanthus]|uniref:uncharacterized protein LOC110960395 isoform X3 n=1 Tax=Acanthochromis polyacanthus TaxID=80966 RepID=UPI00223432A3|nr:uncharacterized protein LOC110960395 isoform X3 [Acanthochromis polyacanthus]